MADEIIDLLQVRIEKAKAALPVETSNAIAAVDWKDAIIGMRAKKGYTFEQLGDLELETELLLCGLVSPEDYPKELGNSLHISSKEANELVNDLNETIFKRIREELIKNVERKKIFASRIAAEEKRMVDKEKTILKSAGIEILDQPSSPAGGKEPTAIVPSLTELPSREDMLKKIERPELIAMTEPAGAFTPGNTGGEKPKEVMHPVRSPEGAPEDSTSNGIHPLLAQKFSSSFGIPMVQTEYSLNNMSKPPNAAQPIDEIKKIIPESPPITQQVEVSASLKAGLPIDIAARIKPVTPPPDQTPKSYSVNADPYRLKPE